MEESSDGIGPPPTFVCSFWREFNLDGRRAQLDEVGLQVAAHQDESVRNRRKLAESTKEFRKSASEGVVKTVGDLLKQYQQEVDRLTKRAKHSESAYLELYQKLCEAPDPAPVLSSAVDNAARVSELEAQVGKQAQELGEFKAEAKEIKNQDLTIRKLEDKIRALEGEVNRKVAEAEAANKELSKGREQEFQEREARLQSILDDSQEELEVMRKLHNATQDQIFALQSANEEERAGHRTKLEIAVAEIEQAQERVLTLENEKKRLVETVKMLKSESGDHEAEGANLGATDSVSDGLMAELAMQRNVEQQLRGELSRIKSEMTEARENVLGDLEAVKSALSLRESQIESYEEELASRPTLQQVDDLKQQLRMLQSIQYSAADGEEDADGTDPSGDAASQGPMSRVLLHKTRHLEHELTSAKRREAALAEEVDSIRASNKHLEVQLEEQKDLVVKLEEDLLSAQSIPTRDGAGSVLGGSGEDGPSGQQALDDGSQTMAGVLEHQRDRYKRKADQLREELSGAQMEAARNQAEAAAAKADNVVLVERIRFLQGYRKNNINQSDIEAGVDTERKYSKEYEARMNPFTEFQSRQRENRKKQMGVVDKTVYIIGDLVFGNKYARLFVFFYMVLMHVFVMTTLVLRSHKPGGPHILDVEEMGRFCKEHVRCGVGGVVNFSTD